jgi:hypothetical protein
MDQNQNRDVRSEALADLTNDQDRYRPEPGTGARMALRATEIERDELMGVVQRDGLWARFRRWLGSLRR